MRLKSKAKFFMGRDSVKLRGAEKAACVLTALFILAAAGVTLAANSGQAVAVQAPASQSAELSGGDTEVSQELAPGEKVNINTADAAGLEKLPGVGLVLAGRIIDYRTENGPFASVEDIMAVPGIGQGKFDAMKGSLTT